MKPFTIYPQLIQRFPGQQEKLVSLLLNLVEPDIIYLLGARLTRRRTESIFCEISPGSTAASEYYLLVLLPDLKEKSSHYWQEKIEQGSKGLVPVTTIVLETSIFKSWLENAHPFPVKVSASAVPIYNRENAEFSFSARAEQTRYKKPRQLYNEGLNRVKEFLAGAELFRLRQQNKMSAFMLHQATEHSLRTLFKISTGFHYNTHNLDRLIRYCSMVSYKLPDIFPGDTSREKQLFKLLQSAYIDSRYSSAYTIYKNELLILTDRVKQMADIFITTSQHCIKLNVWE